MAEIPIRRNLFREVNEQITRVNADFGGGESHYSLLCECERPGCLERLRIPVAVWEKLSGDDERFVVLAGHEEDGTERIVASDQGYSIIRVVRGNLHVVDPAASDGARPGLTAGNPLPAA